MNKIIKFLSVLLVLTMLCGCGGNAISSSETDASGTPAPSSTALDIPDITVPIDITGTPAADDPSSETPSSSTSSGTDDIDLSKVIAITFDDGPDMRYTSSTGRILDVLEEYDCKATFFIQTIQITYDVPCNEETGESFVTRNKALIAREHELGMEIGTHSFDHPNFNNLSDEEIQYQIDKSCSMIKEITGEDVKIMRTPYGAHEDNVLAAVDLPIILWSIDTLDWDTKDAQNTYNVILEQVTGGSIILMHDIYKETADAVEMVVPELVARGYKLVTVSELFELYGKTLTGHNYYCSAN